MPTAWFIGHAVALVLPALTGRPEAALVLSGLYLVVTAGWALLRRRSAVGRRGLGGTVAVGVVVLLAGGAVADPPPADVATTTPSASPAPAPSAAPAATPGAGLPSAADATPDLAPTATPSPDDAGPPGTADAAAGTALATALDLEVKGRAPRAGYDRGLFGGGWVDTDRNGCDTRNDILARDLTGVSHRPGTRDCVVVSGVLGDPYSGRRIEFVRGDETSNAVQVDHVVALSDAWQKGAQQWDSDTRVRFGNDPLNLLAVDGPLNMQKGDGDTATWLPPNRSYRCPYVARQVAVKDAYGLWVTQAEQDAMVRVLGDCPGQPLPSGSAAREVGAAPEPPVPAPADHARDVPYPSCAAARAAGVAPARVGDPGYGTHLDGDGDGVACE
ncbi:GmrSD restriction endonuclease domain-containing protein [Georgenia sp. H159]|uniref:GmrSD restriction endonuclease domain-containing protein n=1 Tax=Georgenia sp. H159 TaxID=3076115 RepID=UPI002D7697FF|nr:DUF1524 domain-containing protein [Georgenia sp. H159]